MPEDLLTRIQRELRDRLEQLRQAFEESQRLEAALAALDVQREAPRRSAGRARRGPARPRSAQRRARLSQPRARPGESQARILQVIDERPGVSAAEVAASNGIARNTVASILQRLVTKGHLAKDDLPSGVVGFRVAGPPDQPDDTSVQAEAAAHNDPAREYR